MGLTFRYQSLNNLTPPPSYAERLRGGEPGSRTRTAKNSLAACAKLSAATASSHAAKEFLVLLLDAGSPPLTVGIRGWRGGRTSRPVDNLRASGWRGKGDGNATGTIYSSPLAICRRDPRGGRVTHPDRAAENPPARSNPFQKKIKNLIPEIPSKTSFFAPPLRHARSRRAITR